MQINNNINCRKPRTFTGGSEQSKQRYKHFEQLSDEVLAMRSVMRAHRDVENSGKMLIFKSMPTITAGAIGTSLALTQPGNFAAKAAAGLGFLVLNSITNKALDISDKFAKENESHKKTQLRKLKTILLTSAGVIGTAIAFSKIKNTNAIKKFALKEFSTLANELNNTKIGKFVNKHLQKTPKMLNILPFASIFGGAIMEYKLQNSLSKDVKEKARQHFFDSKVRQAIARQDFEEIDAIEV